LILEAVRNPAEEQPSAAYVVEVKTSTNVKRQIDDSGSWGNLKN
jgi:hypothetical protein